MTRVRPAVRRAAFLVVVGLVVAVVCTFLGRWQWHRHVVRDARIAVVETNWAAPPARLRDVVPASIAAPDADDEWRSVTVTGEYLPEATVLLRNRPVDGHPAYHVLVPFRVDGLSFIVVDRGWVPLGDDGQTVADVPAPPAGTVELVARLRVPESPSNRSAPPGQVQTIDVAQVLAAGGLPPEAATLAYRWYAGLVSEDPAPAAPLGTLPTPSTDPGPHLSYAFQWWVFGLGGLLAFGWLARRELTDDAAARARAADVVGAAGAAASAGPHREVTTATGGGAAAGSTSVDGAAAVVTVSGGSAARDREASGSDATAGIGQVMSGNPAAGSGATAVARGDTADTPGASGRPVTPAAPSTRRRRGRDELAEDALIDAQLRETHR